MKPRDVFDTSLIEEFIAQNYVTAPISEEELAIIADRLGRLLSTLTFRQDVLMARIGSAEKYHTAVAAVRSLLETARDCLAYKRRAAEAKRSPTTSEEIMNRMCCQCLVKEADADYGLCRVCCCETPTRNKWREVAEARAAQQDAAQYAMTVSATPPPTPAVFPVLYHDLGGDGSLSADAPDDPLLYNDGGAIVSAALDAIE